MMRFASLGSGSEGNGLVVQAGEGASCTRVLVDCGFGIRELDRRLRRLGLAPGDLHAVLVTHEHGDHVSGVAALVRRHGIPVHMTPGTARACARSALPLPLLRLFDPHAPFEVRGLRVEPFPVPHDACEPVQYVFDDGRARLGVLTDIGHATALLPRVLARLDGLVLECNHDTAMLRDGHYPPALKRRVGGDYGHLCNEDAAVLLKRLDQSRLSRVVAAHLSRHNNRPALAQAALADALGAAPGDVFVADQDLGLDWQPLDGPSD